ncbi:MAG: TRAP transporter large permease subunit [Gammaproteobacteria bacterium]|nr:TRAP transporter large permease subunit [Gammaproteobacteria bacterium]MBL7000150.1 TRAP transporter large permease subunit [Gammaproteobacteria bacterium]
MELYFLVLLIVLMIVALSSGFPVAFALPGSAILTIAIAALFGYLLVGDSDAFFAQGGPNQWLSAGVTNLRSLYWVVERDTLIAIPLFVFMGIMLQRSKVAQDLLVAMAQLFGPVPGGLGISVVLVGALLAATTGIVGATVIAMGLISLPAMLRNHYSPSLACGTICASGTLGQIIPPSIVLIILADQLSSAADQANSARKAEYKAITGEFSMPGDFDVVSASAGDMFMGAFIPGVILVGLYMGYIFISALIRPQLAPAVPYQGQYNRAFLFQLLLALVPPLVLIFSVLGSIVLGVATVNQAGAIGAIGALLMSSYRLREGRKRAYYPAALALFSVVVIGLLLHNFDLNIRHIDTDQNRLAINLAIVAVLLLLLSVGWSIVRAYKTDNILNAVMMETAKTTSMVFIILIGAAMLTSAFRAFGGDELVKHALSGLPGGFWMQFLVVMLVIFLLGFFLDFIEIAVVVVPIVAPILLADPAANVSAVWLGVLIGLNIQTSFLTPPFGFALFYLRGVAPAIVKTLHIYKGAVAFIALQLLALAIAASFPLLVNYLPNRSYLTSETAPPPNNPRLQLCIEQRLFAEYEQQGESILAALAQASALDMTDMPKNYRRNLIDSLNQMSRVSELVGQVQTAHKNLDHYVIEYQPLHREVRAIELAVRKMGKEIGVLEDEIQRLKYVDQVAQATLPALQQQIVQLQREQTRLNQSIPEQWKAAREHYLQLVSNEKSARNKYRLVVDDSYQVLQGSREMISGGAALLPLQAEMELLSTVIREQLAEAAMEQIKQLETTLSSIKNTHSIKARLSSARKALKSGEDRDKASAELMQGRQLLDAEIDWRRAAQQSLLAGLSRLDSVIKNTIGLRMQPRLSHQQAEDIAVCLAHHRDVSLAF